MAVKSKKSSRKMVMEELTPAKLRHLLCYNPFTGNFIWRNPPPHSRKAKGEIAGYAMRTGRYTHFYHYIKIKKCLFRAHRLAFFYMRGYWPREEVDHKDGNGLNNRWLNLRECTRVQNMANQNVNRNNKLGVKGIIYCQDVNKYRAQFQSDGKRYYLGYFETLDEAEIAYNAARTKTDGEFVKTES